MGNQSGKWALGELNQWSKSLLERLVKAKVSLSSDDIEKVERQSPNLFIVPYYTIAEILVYTYVFSRKIEKNFKLILPKSILNSPISLFVLQRGLRLIDADEEPGRFAEELLSDGSFVVWYPESGFVSDEEYLENSLGFSPFYSLSKNIFEEVSGMKSLLEKQEGSLSHKINWLITAINYIPSRFGKNPFSGVCNLLYEELASGYLNRIDIANTFVDEKCIVEIALSKIDEVNTENIRETILSSASLFSPNFEKICVSLFTLLPPFAYSERQLRNKLLLFWKALKEKIDCKRLEILFKLFENLSAGEKVLEKENLFSFLSNKGVVRITKKGLYRIRVSNHQNAFQKIREMLRCSLPSELNINEKLGLNKKNCLFIKVSPDWITSYKLAREIYKKDLQIFEEDYTDNYHSEWTKEAEVGRPFFLFVPGSKIGVVLSHGYLSAPMEVRALGEYLYKSGISVYGVRLKGHGTSPLDLAKSKWEEWYDSLNRGVSALRCLYDRIYICGFSAGGCLALYSASRKNISNLAGIISISAPIKLQNYAINLLPTVITLNYVFKRFGGEGWDLLEHKPENPHINYQKNPLAGLRQLRYLMEETEKVLPQVKVPTLVIQGSNDNTVNPESANIIFEQLGAEKKYKLFFNRNNHGIINGPLAPEIFSAVKDFILKGEP